MIKNVLDRIVVNNLKHYLSDLFIKYNEMSFPLFMDHCEHFILTHRQSSNFSKLFYFQNFFPIFQIIEPLTSKELIPAYNKNIESLLIKHLHKNEITQFFYNYGNINKTLLKRLYSNFHLCNQSDFIKISQIFYLNNFAEYETGQSPWEDIAINFFHKFSIDQTYIEARAKNNLIFFKLLMHLNEFRPFIDQNIIKEVKCNQDQEATISKTEQNLKDILQVLNIQFISNYEKYYQQFDYYLPDLDLYLEFLGPDHFYPLQTQLKEKSKNKYLYNLKAGRKIIIIPYWEYSRYDHIDATSNYIRKLIYEDFDLTKGPLFRENFDFFVSSKLPLNKI